MKSRMRICMKADVLLTHKFVECIPDQLDERTLYVSIPYATVVHRCCCGCGREVVTPLSPVSWNISFDGESISLSPSVGSWSLPCQSHYWIRNNRAQWAPQWSKERIAAGRESEALRRESHFSNIATAGGQNSTTNIRGKEGGKPKKNIWQKLKRWLP